MFKNDYQSGTFFEVFSAQGKEPLAHWKLAGSPVKREFDKEVKSYIYHLEGSATSTKMQLPGDSKYSSLALIQRYLVFQLYVPKGYDFSMDLGVTDLGQTKRRIVLSTTYKERQENPLHCKIPILLMRRSKWLNFCVDLHSLVGETWTGQTHKMLDSICISATCKLRRIFTMRGQPPDTTDDDELYKMPVDVGKVDYDNIPKACQFAYEVSSYTQVINMTKVLFSLGMGKKTSTDTESDLNSSDAKKAAAQDPYHIAFGTKVSGSSVHKGSSSKETTSRKTEPSRTAKTDREMSSRSRERENRNSTGSRREGSSTSRGGSAGHREGSATSRGGSGKDRAGSGSKTRSRHKVEVIHPPRPSRPPPEMRDRRDSEPCRQNLPDPDVAVDKDNLRTSHTWTEGADGTEPIPYVRPRAPPVQPHPPAQPSSASRARRKPRVKSASKEHVHQQQHGSAGANRDDLSLSSVPTSTTSSQGSSRANSGTVREYGLAQEELHAGVTQGILAAARNNSRTASESEHTSGGGGGGDELTDVIHALNNQQFGRRLPDHRGDHNHDDDDEEEAGRRAEDTEEDEEPANRLYQYSSKPKAADRQGQTNGARARRKNVNTHRTRGRWKPDEKSKHSKTSMTQDAAASSEDEDTRDKSSRKTSKLSPRKSGSKRDKNSSSRDSGISNGFSHIPDPHLHTITPSPVNSQSRMSISKKSLREIPKDDLRLSGGSKPYVPTNYQMIPDLSDSFEAQLLQSMKREVQEECGTSDDNGRRRDSDGSGGEQSNLSRYRYGDDSSESESEMSTLKPTLKAGQQPHNYQDEMGGLGNEYLTQSNPRVFSPPIVLPSTTHPSSVSLLNNSDNQLTDVKFSQYKKAPPVQQAPVYQDMKEYSDQEDELDLLYDQVLNCYYDPKTNKYYELV